MGMFGFDDQNILFDDTPVENHFILEYMPMAKGDYVKVYLYGLLNCYHPQPDMSLPQMAKELSLPEEVVLSAFRYWERRRLVQRVSDNPPEYRYLNIKQQVFLGNDLSIDREYEEFCEMVHAAFDYERELHTNELIKCYEWVKDDGLQPEVVVLLIKHMISIRGKNFSISAADKVAVMLAGQNAFTIDDAELVLGREKQVWDGTRKLLRRLGKKFREPSEDEMNLYQKWLYTWNYTPEAVEAACAETTKGEPTMAYLDGILQGMMERSGKAATSREEVEQNRRSEKDREAPLKEVLKILGVQRETTVNAGTLAVYDEMRRLYPDEIIRMAATECARYGRKFEDVMSMLESWNNRSLRTREDVEAHIRRFNESGRLLRSLYDSWGIAAKPNGGDRALLQKWTDTWGFSEEYIVFCAAFAMGREKPMLYLDSVLDSYQQQNIRTNDAALAAHAAWQQQYEKQQPQTRPAKAERKPKTVREQQYHQREYQNTTDIPDWMKADLEAPDDDEE